MFIIRACIFQNWNGNEQLFHFSALYKIICGKREHESHIMCTAQSNFVFKNMLAVTKLFFTFSLRCNLRNPQTSILITYSQMQKCKVVSLLPGRAALALNMWAIFEEERPTQGSRTLRSTTWHNYIYIHYLYFCSFLHPPCLLSTQQHPARCPSSSSSSSTVLGLVSGRLLNSAQISLDIGCTGETYNLIICRSISNLAGSETF